MNRKWPLRTVAVSLILRSISSLAVGGSPQVDVTITERPLLVLGEGEQRLIHVPGLLKFSLGSTRVHAVRPPVSDTEAGSPLLLRGVEAGPCDLWIWSKNKPPEHRLIQVERWSEKSADPLPVPLKQALSRLEETEIRLTPQGVALSGEIQTLSELRQVARLHEDFPVQIIDRTLIRPALLDQGEARLREWLRVQKKAFPIERHDDRLTARVRAASAADRKNLELRMKSIFPALDFENETSLDSNPTIYFRVFLLELKKDQFSSLGLQWPTPVEGAFQVTPTALRQNLSLDLNLEMLAQKGYAKILSKPELAVRSPGEAELFSGGELPIHNQARFHSDYAWKSFGLTLKLKVQETEGDRVRLEISTEVSHLDASIAADQVPGLRSNRMRTQVDARFGKPLLLSGLLQEDVRRQARGLPILSEIPVLGALFGSKDYQNEQSELVAILLPQSVTPDPFSNSAMHAVDEGDYPIGKTPSPRNWLSKEEIEKLKQSPDYPWNVF